MPQKYRLVAMREALDTEVEAEGISIADVEHWVAESQALDRIEAAAQDASSADLAAVVYEELSRLPGRKAPR